MFKYNWKAFNVRLGLIFTAGVLITFYVLAGLGFDSFAAGISALLAWVPIVLVPNKKWKYHVRGILYYLVIGSLLTLLANFLLPHTVIRLVSMGVITFLGYMMLIRGSHPYLVAWCSVYWYLLAPLFVASGSFESTLVGHIIGSGIVLVLISLKPIWELATRKTVNGEIDNKEETPPFGFVLRYSAVVSLTISAGLAAGTSFLSSDPTLIANASLNMISPSFKQTWQMGLERLILGSTGIVTGFYIGWYFPQPEVGAIIAILFSFLSLGCLYVNMNLVIGLLFIVIAYPWGTMRSDLGHQIGNEKILSELIGVMIAVVTIGLLTWIPKMREFWKAIR